MITLRLRKRFYRTLGWLLLICILAVGALALDHFTDLNFFPSELHDEVKMLEVLLTVCGGLLVIRELFSTRSIAEGEFLSNLNKSFVGSKDYKKAYSLIQHYIDQVEHNADKQKILNAQNELSKGLTKADISNYLTFFEVFQLLRDRNTLTIPMFDDLFAYRFFMAVHNPVFQQEKLIHKPDNFRNIYRLEHDWMRYRKFFHRDVYGASLSLQKQYLSSPSRSLYGYYRFLGKGYITAALWSCWDLLFHRSECGKKKRSKQHAKK